jgi:hypothetical protein
MAREPSPGNVKNNDASLIAPSRSCRLTVARAARATRHVYAQLMQVWPHAWPLVQTLQHAAHDCSLVPTSAGALWARLPPLLAMK